MVEEQGSISPKQHFFLIILMWVVPLETGFITFFLGFSGGGGKTFFFFRIASLRKDIFYSLELGFVDGGQVSPKVLLNPPKHHVMESSVYGFKGFLCW